MRKQFECHGAVVCQFNVADLLSHSDAFDRTSRLIGFQTVRSRWGGCNQSKRRTKVSEPLKLGVYKIRFLPISKEHKVSPVL